MEVGKSNTLFSQSIQVRSAYFTSETSYIGKTEVICHGNKEVWASRGHEGRR